MYNYIVGEIEMTEYKYLDKINSPADIKDLREDEILSLADEIRSFLIEKVEKNGGHLASNLIKLPSDIIHLLKFKFLVSTNYCSINASNHINGFFVFHIKTNNDAF